MNINAGRRTLIKCMGITAGLALIGLQPAFAYALAATPPMPPVSACTATDARGWAMNVSAGTPVSEEARAVFLKKKIKTAATQKALRDDQRTQATAQIFQRIGVTLPSSQGAPAPGGVGYGVFCNDSYKQALNAGTAGLRLDLSAGPEGNVDTWLYLTATNRAALGISGSGKRC